MLFTGGGGGGGDEVELTFVWGKLKFGGGGGARGRSLLGLEIFLDGMEGEMSRESFDYLIKTLIINLKEFTVNSIWESNLPLEHKIHVYTVSKGINQWDRLTWKMAYLMTLANNTK